MERKCNPHITCTVMTCIYNKNSMCSAEHIYIGTEYASDVVDTVCASYQNITD